MLRALNANQLLILEEISKGNRDSITQVLSKINKEHRIPLSTLKLNTQILRKLGLIDFGTNSHFRKVEVTDLGKEVLAIISQSSLTGKAAVCKTANLGSNPGSEIER